jgi:hypothetical protein
VSRSSIAMLALPGAGALPDLHGKGSPDHLGILGALDDAIDLVSTRRPLAWDGPDHPSLSWDLEMEDFVEVGIHEFASVLQFTVCVVAPMETGLSRSVVTVRDERLPRGWLRTRTPHETRDVVLALLQEWRTICGEAEVIDSGPDGVRRIPHGMSLAARRTIARFGALAVAHGMDERLGAQGMELMWHLRHATSRTEATLCASASGDEEATFDDRTMRAVFEGLPEATWVKRDGTSPMSLTIAPFVWSVGSLEEVDALRVLRELGEMGIDWDPELVVRDERA